MKIIAATGVLILIGMLCAVAKMTHDMNSKLDTMAAIEPQKAMGMTTDTTTWKSAYGMKSLTTTRGANETKEAWAARTLEEVKAMQVTFPIVP